MAPPDYFKAIQILAARDVVMGSPEYYERYVLRWFSKTFSTPYPMVLEMPFEDVLQAFYEERYATLEEDKLEQELLELLETPAERSARFKAEEDEELMLQRLTTEAEQHNRKLEDVVSTESKSVLPPKELKESGLPEISGEELRKLIKPDVEMKFATPEDLEKLIAALDAKQDPEKPQS